MAPLAATGGVVCGVTLAIVFSGARFRPHLVAICLASLACLTRASLCNELIIAVWEADLITTWPNS